MKCEDCIHQKVCESWHYAVIDPAERYCKYTLDKNRLIELPCKIGDTVYFYDESKGITEAAVDHFEMYGDKVQIAIKEKYAVFPIIPEAWGDKIYFNKEDALNALKDSKEVHL